SLSIEPGTVIKGAANAVPAEATALVIERGGKLFAAGTESCPIVFTAAADPMDGSYAISNIGKWGGVVILGRATNNLTLAANGPYVPGGAGKLAVADGLGTIEGFATSNTQDQYGVNLSAGETFNDDDNSGVLKYVSIRHSGAILAVGAEINGLTLGSVGRGTTIEHLEIVSCADDNIEFFGGTVNLKYVTTLFGNDDMYDWDCGYTGKMQFVFGMKSDATSSPDNDSGIEADGDDNKSNLLPRSHPVIYNATFMGNGKATNTADNTGLAGITAKELTEGEIYNSVFANFKNGLWLVKSLSGNRNLNAGNGDSWHNWTNILPAVANTPTTSTGNGSQSLKVVCNTFVGVTNALTNGSTAIAPGTADYIQFDETDMNDVVTAIPGFDYSFALNTTTNVFSQKNDVTPNPALGIAGCPTPPVDGFFEPANYRGAFSSVNGENWLSNWSYSHVLNATTGVRACATDLNLDGVTDVNDFLIFAPAFGTSCN
ncbi:MAG: hypothetical protein NWP82_03750, partial [Flavobacteriales bacterium]|nr:hypothetical protein [Flavobacteriales bacterium]